MPNHGVLEAALAILARRPEQNAYPILRIRQGCIQTCLFEGSSVCLLDSESGKFLYCLDNFDEFNKLYNQVQCCDGALVSLATDDRLFEKIASMPGVRADRFFQLAAADFYGEAPAVPGVAYDRVGEDAVEWMLEVYEHPEMSREFILRRAVEGPSVTAWHEGRPVGFFITHSAAEIGPVYVDPAFRGSGLAEALYARMMQQVSGSAWKAPVLFVREENTRSYKWLVRMGCIPATEKILWFWRV